MTAKPKTVTKKANGATDRSSQAPPARTTTDEDREAGAKAARRQLVRRPPVPATVELGDNGALQIAPAIDDERIYSAILADVCGTRSPDWLNMLLTQISNAGNEGKPANAPAALKAGMAFMNGLAPRDEVESALGAQMFAAHSLAMHMARRAGTLDHIDWIKMAADQMNKASRTYIASVEALARLRSGGKQQVEVRYIYVGARGGQNVIASNVGGGGAAQNEEQPHGPHGVASLPFAPGVQMWGEDAGGDALPVAGAAGEAALSHPRREEHRSPDGSL